MSLKLIRISELKDYIDSWRGVPIFFERSDKHFAIRAGHASWKGDVSDDKEAEKLQKWLVDHGAKESDGWIEDSELFA